MRRAIFLILLVLLMAFSNKNQQNAISLSDSEKANQCMQSLETAREQYSNDTKDENLIMHSINSSQLFLYKKLFGVPFHDNEKAIIELAVDPHPVFFSDKAEYKLIYPNLGYLDTSIEMDLSKEKFDKMTSDWSGPNKPWQVDAIQLKKLPGCSVLPFKDIPYSSAGGATRTLAEENDKSHVYDYINTLNMWSDNASATKDYDARIKQAQATHKETGIKEQFVYLQCSKCDIESLTLQNSKEVYVETEDKMINVGTEIKFKEIESSNGWHIFKAEVENSPWLETPPYLLDDINGYSQFILQANGQTFRLLNQYNPIFAKNYKIPDDESQINPLVGYYYAGQARLVIDSYQDDLIKGRLSYATPNLSQLAEADFSGKIKDNQLKFTFEGDGYGTQGNTEGILTLNQDHIQVELKIMNQKYDGWSLPEGKLIFQKSLKTYTATDPYVERYRLEGFIQKYLADSFSKEGTLLDSTVESFKKIKQDTYDVSVTLKLEVKEKDKTETKTLKQVYTITKKEDGLKITNIKSQ